MPPKSSPADYSSIKNIGNGNKCLRNRIDIPYVFFFTAELLCFEIVYYKRIKYMRIVTRPDFDGVVCAVLLRDIFEITEPVKWIEPYEMKNRAGEIVEGDIIANLPYSEGCSLWFDHHLSNRTDADFEGAFREAPSAAGIIFEYYKGKFSRDFTELVHQTDRIDSADITMDEVLNSADYPFMLLSSTISGRGEEDEAYWNRVVGLLLYRTVEQVMEDEEVRVRYSAVLEKDRIYSSILKEHTEVLKNISVTDFRALEIEPKGNRFLVYSLFPDILVDVKIRYNKNDRTRIVLSMGQNIFKKGNRINLGEIASLYDGGGHRGAGSCSFPVSEAEETIRKITEVLEKQ